MSQDQTSSKPTDAEQPTDEGLLSSALFGRLLFVYARAGQIQCYSAGEIRGKEAILLEYGWKHTATIDPARWIEAMANNGGKTSDMLDELQSLPNAELRDRPESATPPHNQPS